MSQRVWSKLRRDALQVQHSEFLENRMIYILLLKINSICSKIRNELNLQLIGRQISKNCGCGVFTVQVLWEAFRVQDNTEKTRKVEEYSVEF